MPYFSFSVTKSILQQNFILNDPHMFNIIQNTEPQEKYYSKYNEIFKVLKKNIDSSQIISLKKEKNNKYLFSNKSTIPRYTFLISTLSFSITCICTGCIPSLRACSSNS